MALKKETGIVVQSRNIADADSMITLLGKTGPKQKFLIRGLRKSRRRPIAAAETGSIISIDYYSHSQREILNVKEVSLLERFEKIKSSYGGFLLVSYMAEFADRILPEGETHEKMFLLFEQAMNSLEKEGYFPLLLPVFKLRILHYSGVLPKEFYCSSCGENILDKKTAYFNPQNFEIHCGDCHAIPKNNIEIIRFLVKVSRTSFQDLKEANVPDSIIQDTDFFLNGCIRNYLNISLKTSDMFYKSLGKNYELPV
ncbi:MAG: DNA repair protein RecO [Leptospira sp.]|nr:DNA repair protein RecO [Leptospira sp.]